MNLIKKSSVEKGIRGGIGASKEVRALVRALLLLTLNLWTKSWPVSSSCFPMRLARGLIQGFYQAQDFGAIIIEIWSGLF